MRRPWLERRERPLRGWPTVGRPERPKSLPAWWPQARALLEQGHSLKSVGETVGVSRQRVAAGSRQSRKPRGRPSARRRQNPPAPRPCAQCGTVFRPHSEKALYCSRQCAGLGRSEKTRPVETIRRAFDLRIAGKSYWEIAELLRISPDRAPAISPDKGAALRQCVGQEERPRSARYAAQAPLAPVACRNPGRSAYLLRRACKPRSGDRGPGVLPAGGLRGNCRTLTEFPCRSRGKRGVCQEPERAVKPGKGPSFGKEEK